jgi:hypothetical protein
VNGHSPAAELARLRVQYPAWTFERRDANTIRATLRMNRARHITATSAGELGVLLNSARQRGLEHTTRSRRT